MAVLLGGDFKVTQVGHQTVLEIHAFRSGGAASGSYFVINNAAMVAIEAAIASAGAGVINEDIPSGTAIAIPDNTYASRVNGSASWDRANTGEVYIDFSSGFSCTSIIDVYARFVLFNDPP